MLNPIKALLKKHPTGEGGPAFQPTLVHKVALSALYSVIVVSLGLGLFLYNLSMNLPPLSGLEKPDYELPTQVFDRQGQLITEFYTQRRVLLPIEKVPTLVIQALLAIEDSRFYDHWGVDPIRMVKALIIDVIRMDFAQGASTLTQQTAKMFLLSSEKKLVRKFKEVLLALKIEARFSKEQILELYLNKTYFGHGAYGLEAAAQGYFSKHATELTLPEAALLAGLPQAPSRWAPTVSIDNATRRRNLVLRAMKDQGFISPETYERTVKEPIRLRLNKNDESNETSYFTEQVRKMILKAYGMKQLYEGGMQVFTTMDLKQQITAQRALMRGLEEHDQRQGYRGAQLNLWQVTNERLYLDFYDPEKGLKEFALKQLPQEEQTKVHELYQALLSETTQQNRLLIGGEVRGVVTKVGRDLAEVDLGGRKGQIDLEGLSWARPVDYEEKTQWQNQLRDLTEILHRGDVILLKLEDYDQATGEFALTLTQKPQANGGILAIDPRSGEVRAMSGGYDFKESEFNRAVQSKRQPGSAFKPLVYSLAFDNSFTRASLLEDKPLVFKDSQWVPGNYSKTFKGKIPLKLALAQSKNIPTINLTMALGTDKVIEHARKLGITADLPQDLTLGLGSGAITLEEMVDAYAVFANGGKLIRPLVYITKVLDRDGKPLDYEEDNKLQKWNQTKVEQVMSPETSFLMTATLQDVVKLGSGWRAQSLGRPAAGKTGTTNNFTDAWFIGYVPQLLAGVYVGFDNTQRILGKAETGSRAAAPIWVDFMEKSLLAEPILPFSQPEGVQMVKINPKSGLLSCDPDGKFVFEYFKQGTQPTQCHQDTVDFPSQLEPETDQETGQPAAPVEEL